MGGERLAETKQRQPDRAHEHDAGRAPVPATPGKRTQLDELGAAEAPQRFERGMQLAQTQVSTLEAALREGRVVEAMRTGGLLEVQLAYLGRVLGELEGAARTPYARQLEALRAKAEPLLARVRGVQPVLAADAWKDAISADFDVVALTDVQVLAGSGGTRAATPTAPQPGNAFKYAAHNEVALRRAIRDHLAATRLPASAHFKWTAAAFADAFAGAVARTERSWFDGLHEALRPADLWWLLDQYRPLESGTPGDAAALGPLRWHHHVGTAVATELTARLRESLERMVPRFETQLEVMAPVRPAYGDLVKSHPVDRVVAHLLVDERVTTVARVPKRTKSRTRGVRDFASGVQFLQEFEWLGSRDPALWNWIHVKAPADAQPEDVLAGLDLIATTNIDSDATALTNVVITNHAPFFEIHPDYARRHVAHGHRDPRASVEDGAIALASSALATDAAVAQAAAYRPRDKRGNTVPHDFNRMSRVLATSQRQLAAVMPALASWKLNWAAMPALRWVEDRISRHLATGDKQQDDLVAVYDAQQELLFEAVGELHDLLAEFTGVQRDDKGPVARVIKQYALTLGQSHLLVSARTQLAKARAARAQLPLDLLDHGLRHNQAAVGNLRQLGGAAAAEGASADYDALQSRLLAMRTQQADGLAPSRVDVDLLGEELASHAMVARYQSVGALLRQLVPGVKEAASGVSGYLADWHGDASKMEAELLGAARELDAAIADHARRVAMSDRRVLAHAGTDAHKQARLAGLQEAARGTQARLDEIVKTRRLDEAFAGNLVDRATQLITDLGRRRIVIDVIALIALSVATSGLATMAGGAVRGALYARAAVSSARFVQTARRIELAASATNIATDAALSTVGSRAITGRGDGFVDNVASNVLIVGAVKNVQRLTAAWGVSKLDLANRTRWQRLGDHTLYTAAHGASATGEMLTGAAVAYVYERARRGPNADEATLNSWALQGASMALGRVVSARMRGLELRMERLAEHGALLKVRARELRVLARRVERTGDKDQALELLARQQELLRREAEVLDSVERAAPVRADLVDALRTSNKRDAAIVSDQALALMPLRLAGLTPDDAAFHTWKGTTEQIALALHQAQRSGLQVDVLERNPVAREWRIRYGELTLTIHELARAGRVRPVNPAADRVRARRYGAAADFIQARWEAQIKAKLDATPVVELEHIQIGYSSAGVMNQDTLPAGENLNKRLIVYRDRGTLAGRGQQELGQSPDKWDAPGMRSSEQSPKDAAWIRSAEHDRALAVGRAEMQTPAYRAKVLAIEARPEAGWQDDATAPARRLRVQVNDGQNIRWFYADRIDHAGGMGPASLKAVRDLGLPPGDIEAMLQANQLLRADDPDFDAKRKTGRVLVWGGSPSGAWAAEASARTRGNDVTVLGRGEKVRLQDLLRQYEQTTERLAHLPDGTRDAALEAQRDAIEAEIRSHGHDGATIRRNRKRGAAYGPDSRVKTDFGQPTRIEVLENGKLRVTVSGREPEVYDQVVVAHGQDPTAIGGVGHMLGGETKPDGTFSPRIALRPIEGPNGDLLGLESIDPPGIRLLGAAYASAKLAPWVAEPYRDRFARRIDEMAARGAQTRDYGRISEDSTKVSPGIEVQRDRLPRANEVLAAQSYRLPGAERTLELPKDGPVEAWAERLRQYMAVEMRADLKQVSVVQLKGGRSGAVIFDVKVGGNEVGVLKIFPRPGSDAINEQSMLTLLADAKLKKLNVVRERGLMKTGASGKGDALLMDKAEGQSIEAMLKSLPPAGNARADALERLRAALVSTADGLAEMHKHFSAGAGEMTETNKKKEIDYVLKAFFHERGQNRRLAQARLGSDFERVRTAAEGPIKREFIAANIPATAYHGDANAGNFVINNATPKDGTSRVTVIDVGSMHWSVANKRGIATGAADVARLLGSLESLAPGALTDAELVQLRDAFMEGYESAGATHLYSAAAERWYRLQMELAIIRDGSESESQLARARIITLIKDVR